MRQTFPLRSLLAVLVASSVLLVAGAAEAQRPLQQVLDLNRQGMDAYNNLDIEAAQAKLQQALEVAQRGHVTGAPLARTYLNLGVVAVGGMSDNGGGLSFFIQALQTDPTVQLDPLTSTPDIQTVFNLARARTGGGGGGGNNGGGGGNNGGGGGNNGGGGGNNGGGGGNNGGGGGHNGGGFGGGGGVRVAGNIPHTPIPEQTAETAIPVFLEVPSDVVVGHVYLYYKAQGMPAYRRVEMQHIQGGYGFEIPCTDVFQPSVAYYIEALGAGGDSIGTAGTDTDPVLVPIVTHLSGDAPHLPGRPPPQICSNEECPPGMPGCHGGGHGNAGLGDTCNANGDCQEGLHCEDNFCVTGDAGGGGGGEEHHDENASDAPHFFVELGGTVGVAYVGDNQTADSVPNDLNATAPYDTMDGGPWDPNLTAYPTYGSYESCFTSNWANDGGGVTYGVSCGVRVKQPGFLPTFAIRAAVGYYVTDRIGLAATFRFQPDSGSSTLASMLLGVRLQYRVLDAHATGIDIAPFLGVSVGQIQVKPPQNGDDEPFVRSGLVSIDLGGVIVYRFVKNFGLHLTPSVHFFLPDFLFDFDITGGIQVGF